MCLFTEPGSSKNNTPQCKAISGRGNPLKETKSPPINSEALSVHYASLECLSPGKREILCSVLQKIGEGGEEGDKVGAEKRGRNVLCTKQEPFLIGPTISL